MVQSKMMVEISSFFVTLKNDIKIKNLKYAIVYYERGKMIC